MQLLYGVYEQGERARPCASVCACSISGLGRWASRFNAYFLRKFVWFIFRAVCDKKTLRSTFPHDVNFFRKLFVWGFFVFVTVFFVESFADRCQFLAWFQLRSAMWQRQSGSRSYAKNVGRKSDSWIWIFGERVVEHPDSFSQFAEIHRGNSCGLQA